MINVQESSFLIWAISSQSLVRNFGIFREKMSIFTLLATTPQISIITGLYFEVSSLKVGETIFEEKKSKKGDIFEVNYQNRVLILRPDIIDIKIVCHFSPIRNDGEGMKVQAGKKKVTLFSIGKVKFLRLKSEHQLTSET